MTFEQAQEVTAFRSSPLTSKTMWTIYVGQASLAFLAEEYLARVVPPESVVMVALVAGIVALALTGIVGIGWTDPAVNALRAIKIAARGGPSIPPSAMGGGTS